MAEPFLFHHRTSYGDCTVGNHIYYGRYLEILERARGEYLRSIGRSFEALQTAGFVFPVVEAHLKYRAMARYDELLEVRVWTALNTGVRLNFAYRITVGERLILEAETFHVCVGLDEKPRRLPEELRKALEAKLLDTGVA